MAAQHRWNSSAAPQPTQARTSPTPTQPPNPVKSPPPSRPHNTMSTAALTAASEELQEFSHSRINADLKPGYDIMQIMLEVLQWTEQDVEQMWMRPVSHIDRPEYEHTTAAGLDVSIQDVLRKVHSCTFPCACPVPLQSHQGQTLPCNLFHGSKVCTQAGRLNRQPFSFDSIIQTACLHKAVSIAGGCDLLYYTQNVPASALMCLIICAPSQY